MLRRISFLQMLAGVAGVGALTGVMLAFSASTAQATVSMGNYKCDGPEHCVASRLTCTINCEEACSCTTSGGG